jgi:hypothetical protein
VDQALAAQENLRLLKESYEARTGEGPQIVLEAIRRAKSLIVYWKTEAAHIAQPPQVLAFAIAASAKMSANQ